MSQNKHVEGCPVGNDPTSMGQAFTCTCPLAKEAEEKHNCEKWFDEGSGCAICSAGMCSLEDFKERVKYHSWLVSDLYGKLATATKEKEESGKRFNLMLEAGIDKARQDLIAGVRAKISEIYRCTNRNGCEYGKHGKKILGFNMVNKNFPPCTCNTADQVHDRITDYLNNPSKQ